MVRVYELPYSAGLMSQSFWFSELRAIIKMKVAGKNDEEIQYACIEENLFGLPNPYRTKRVYQYVLNRMNQLDASMLKLFIDSDMQTQKLISLVAIIRGDRLFFEFLNEVYREKCILGQLEMTATDVKAFFTRKESQSEVILAWAESTKKHLRTNYIDYLLQAGLLSEDKKSRHITVPIMDVALERKLIADGDESIMKAIAGVI